MLTDDPLADDNERRLQAVITSSPDRNCSRWN